MYNDWIAIWGIILNMVGTVCAVLCIIKMSLKGVSSTRTAKGLDNAEFGVLEQRYYARLGIGIIFVGAIVQIVATVFKNLSLQYMLILIIITVFVILIWYVEEKRRYSKDKEKLKNS